MCNPVCRYMSLLAALALPALASPLAFAQAAPNLVEQQIAISITGKVLAPHGPKSVLNMSLATRGAITRWFRTLLGRDMSNVRISWGWSTSSADYGQTTVPAGYFVGLFIWNEEKNQWSSFKVGSQLSAATTWADGVQQVHNRWPDGGVAEEPSRVFESGYWCVTLGAASQRETGGTFVQAPGATKSCVAVP